MGPPTAVADLFSSLDIDPVGPVHASDRCLLVNADCKRVLPKVPSASVHLVMIDPPYGAQVQSDQDKNWDKAWSREEWQTIVVEVFRVLMPGGHFIIFAGGKPFHTIHSYVLTAYTASFGTPPSYYDLVWYHNANDSRKTQRHIPRSHHENILVYFRTGEKEEVMISNGCLTRTTNDYEHTGRGSVLTVPKDDCRSKEEATVQRFFSDTHSSKTTFDYKPENLLKHLIHDYTHVNGVVLDFCGRHMLCGKAALSMDRQFIGVEIEGEAYKRGVSRLQDKGEVFGGVNAYLPFRMPVVTNSDQTSEGSTISVADSIDMHRTTSVVGDTVAARSRKISEPAKKATTRNHRIFLKTRPHGRAPLNKKWDYEKGCWTETRVVVESFSRSAASHKRASPMKRTDAMIALPPKWRKRMNYGKKLGYIGPEGKAASLCQAWRVFNARSA